MNYLNKALDTFGTAIVSSVYYVLFTVSLPPPRHPHLPPHTSAQPHTPTKPDRAPVATRPWPTAPLPQRTTILLTSYVIC